MKLREKGKEEVAVSITRNFVPCMSLRTRFWCFTLNNPRYTLDVELNIPEVRYCVWQHELSESGTEHLQGYIEFAGAVGLARVRRLIPKAHWEPRRGTALEASAYCKKEETRIDGPWEYGTMGEGQGSRSDLAAFKTAIESGKTDVELKDEFFALFLRYHKMINTVRELSLPPRSQKTEVWFLYGPPGAGKSYWVKQREPDAYWKQPGDAWFDGYRGQDAIVLDEFRKCIQWAMLLQLCDAYPLRVPVKGGFSSVVAKRLYITTNRRPAELYKNSEDDPDKFPLDALTGRIEHFLVFVQGIEFPRMPRSDRHLDVSIREFDNYADALEYM